MPPQRYAHQQYADGNANETDGITSQYRFSVVILLFESLLGSFPEFIHVFHNMPFLKKLTSFGFVDIHNRRGGGGAALWWE